MLLFIMFSDRRHSHQVSSVLYHLFILEHVSPDAFVSSLFLLRQLVIVLVETKLLHLSAVVIVGGWWGGGLSGWF